ncbi:MAG: FtsQ-type POTRA domain-containing protein [Thermodesulfobacteriota bacterium]
MPKKKPVKQRLGKPPKNSAFAELRNKLIILGVAFCVVLGALAAGSFLMLKALERSEFFQVTAIRIQGSQRVTKNQILELSGVDIHTNLLALDLDEVKARVESHEWVESADVDRNWPNRLQITIRERVPVALVSFREGLFYLDRQGIAFAKVLPPEDLDYPVITGLSREQWPPQISGSALGEALQFIRLAGRGSTVLPGQSISEIHLEPAGSLILFLVDRPFPIFLGKGEVATKYHRLARVLNRLYKGNEFAVTAYIRMDYLPDKVLVGLADAV